MNLKELKKMIAEEYSAYTEQAAIPAVDVAPEDIDAGGDEDSEATLKQIYDMLKDYFEGGDNSPEDDAADADMPGDVDGDGDVDADDDNDSDDDAEAESLQERFKKLANIIKG